MLIRGLFSFTSETILVKKYAKFWHYFTASRGKKNSWNWIIPLFHEFFFVSPLLYYLKKKLVKFNFTKYFLSSCSLVNSSAHTHYFKWIKEKKWEIWLVFFLHHVETNIDTFVKAKHFLFDVFTTQWAKNEKINQYKKIVWVRVRDLPNFPCSAERSRRRFPYFWSVRCSLIQRGNREGKKEPLFLAVFRVFFSILEIFPCCIVATCYLPTRRVLKSR